MSELPDETYSRCSGHSGYVSEIFDNFSFFLIWRKSSKKKTKNKSTNMSLKPFCFWKCCWKTKSSIAFVAFVKNARHRRRFIKVTVWSQYNEKLRLTHFAGLVTRLNSHQCTVSRLFWSKTVADSLFVSLRGEKKCWFAFVSIKKITHK